MSSYFAIALVLPLFVIVALLLFFRGISKKNNVVECAESDIVWDAMMCPKCKEPMNSGFVLAGKGIIWSESGSKKTPGTFTTIARALENTISLNMPPALNESWHCKNCKLVLVDHSRMLKVKRAK